MGVTGIRSDAVLRLDELEDGPAEQAGAKAANLAALMRQGLPVPAGFVVIGKAPGERIIEAARALGDVPLAVRSSAVAEDLADASFAGQYETFLNVRGGPELLEAGPGTRAQQCSAPPLRRPRRRRTRPERPRGFAAGGASSAVPHARP